jgi:PPK2 family polyphosphate:nucleotide phosphotransferase
MPPSIAHRVRPDQRLRLRDIDPSPDTAYEGRDDPRYREDLAEALGRLCALQDALLAEASRALLVVLQAPDAAGKDGLLRKVVGPLDSRGVYVWSFKAPNSEELAHDYLWRVHRRAPRRGEITFFNRSHYEDVLVVRVMGLAPEARWKRRFEHLNAFEHMLHDEGTRVVKIFLHISKDEQLARFRERLDVPQKRWKFEPADLTMRAHWDEFQEAYEEVFQKTSTEEAPWYVVPADRKWLRDLAVARILVDVLEDMDPQYPKPKFDPKDVKLE